MNAPYRNELRQRLVNSIEAAGLDLKSASLKLGRNHAYLQQYIRKGVPRSLPEDVREKLAELLGGDANDYRDSDVPGRAPMRTGETILSVPIYDIRASAGAGSLVQDGEPSGWQPYREQELARFTRASTMDLAVIQVAGDSMWETLHDGDKVLVDRTVKRIVKDGIYVIAFEEELLVKRCQRNLEDGSVLVSSDNKAYSPFTVSTVDRLEVIGRVIWIGRALG